MHEDEVIMSLIGQFLGPADWARLPVLCRHFSKFIMNRPTLKSYWLSSFSPEGLKEVMWLAIQHKQPGLIKPVANAKGDVNCVFEQLWFRSPLHRAASRGYSEACRLLLSLRADVRRLDSHGAAPLHLVASKGRLPIVDMLLRHDPDSAHVVDFSGRTPCHMAALKGHLPVVQRLLAARADAAAAAADGKTPVDMAVRGQHWSVVKALESFERQRRLAEEAQRVARHVVRSLLASRQPSPIEQC